MNKNIILKNNNKIETEYDTNKYSFHFLNSNKNNNSTKKINDIPQEIIEKVEKIIEEEHKDYNKYNFGYCHIYWQRNIELLATYGYDWKSPQDLNLGTCYD